MKRTPLTRRAPLKRKTRINPFNKKRGGARFPHLKLPAFRAAVRGMPCCVCGLRTGAWLPVGRSGWLKVVVDPHHVAQRGPGGADAGNLVPLARHLHDELHQHGKRTFARKYGVNLAAVARRVWADYCAANPEEAA